MGPKICLLLLLFGMIMAGASPNGLRGILRKLNVLGHRRHGGGALS
ncbi:MAG TPA: hypothetical protein VFA53_11785 [Xanthobacteraceae bacterium]|nr:hypothetical protein [Xanthobacteraceae bacterium]